MLINIRRNSPERMIDHGLVTPESFLVSFFDGRRGGLETKGLGRGEWREGVCFEICFLLATLELPRAWL